MADDDTESGESGGSAFTDPAFLAQTVAFLGGDPAPVAAAPAVEAKSEPETPTADAESAEGTPAEAGAAPDVAAALPTRGGPSPVLREYLRKQAEREREIKAELAAERERNQKLIEALTAKAVPVEAAPEEPEEDEFADPVEREIKRLSAELNALKAQNSQREQLTAEQHQRQVFQAAMNEIVTEVDSVVAEYPFLADFKQEIYANVELNSREARKPNAKVRELPIAEIARQYAQRMLRVAPNLQTKAAPAKPASPVPPVQAKSPAPVPRHPPASASIPTMPKNLDTMSFHDLGAAWASTQ